MPTTEPPLIVRAVGDIAINRDDPDRVFDGCAGVLSAADLSLCQLESVFTDAPPAPGRADAPLRSPPRNAEAIRFLGATAVSLCGNHVMSCGRAGLDDTIEALRRLGIATFGAGADLTAASRPLTIGARGQRVSVVAANSILPPGCAATPDLAGCRPLRVSTRYEMIEPNQPGTPARILTEAHAEDLAAVVAQVADRHKAGERVIAWLHWGLHLRPEVIADYQPVVGHALIDAGADLVIGSHPHLLKGVEIYRSRAIFYSIGNFAFDLDVGASSARRQYHLYLCSLYPDNPEVPTANNRLYPFSEDSRLTVMIEAAFGEGEPKVGLRPAFIGDHGRPRLLEPGDPLFGRVRDYLALVSRRFGTCFPVEDNMLAPQPAQ